MKYICRLIESDNLVTIVKPLVGTEGITPFWGLTRSILPFQCRFARIFCKLQDNTDYSAQQRPADGDMCYPAQFFLENRAAANIEPEEIETDPKIPTTENTTASVTSQGWDDMPYDLDDLELRPRPNLFFEALRDGVVNIFKVVEVI